MAKKSKIARNKQRIAVVERYAKKRAELKEVLRSVEASDEDKEEAGRKLRGMPRDASRTRVRNRCLLTGRSRGFYRKFGLGRSKLRDKAVSGELPGVTKASW